MTTYRKTWTLMGHSVGEGVAGSSPLYQAAPWLQPPGGAAQATTAAAAAKRTHPGLKMFVSALPWPGATGTPPVTAIGTGAWLDMTLDAALSPGHPHPYASPYQYPSGRSAPITPDQYRADGAGFLGFIYTAGGGGYTGVDLPFAHGLSQLTAEPVYGVKLSIPSSLFLRYDAGSGFDWYGWWSPDSCFDWDIATGRFYAQMIAKMTGAAAALPAGEKLDVRWSVFWFGDNDATLAGFGEDRIARFKEVYKATIKRWRQDLVDNGWTTLPAEQVPILMMGIYKYGSVAHRDQMNLWLQEIADEDPYTKYIATGSYKSLQESGYIDANHLSHEGYLAAAQDMLDAVAEIANEPLDAMDTADLVTVDEVRRRVRLFYENNRVRTGATSDDALLLHINGAMQHMLSKLGDQTFWLRKRVSLEVSSAVGEVHTMPGYVHRVLRIEDPYDATKYLRFQMIGYADGGKLQIQMLDRGGSTFTVHYIENPKELTADAQTVPVPKVALEWLVAEVCKRLSRTTGNILQQQQLDRESAMLHADVARYAATLTRAKHDRLHTQRNLHGRIYGRTRWLRP